MMDFAAPPPFRAAEYIVRLATADWERHGASRLRQAVFCREQGIFDGDDRDDIDEAATTIVALSLIAGEPDEVIGTVRIHEAQPSQWWGSRLAVAKPYRRNGAIGPALIRLAVSSARAAGCTRFLAHVQSPNEFLFRQLHWWRVGELMLFGRKHSLMQANLDYYPPVYGSQPDLRASLRHTA